MPSNPGTGSAACGAVDCKRVRMPQGGVPRVMEDAVGVTVTLVIRQARHRRVSWVIHRHTHSWHGWLLVNGLHKYVRLGRRGCVRNVFCSEKSS